MSQQTVFKRLAQSALNRYYNGLKGAVGENMALNAETDQQVFSSPG